MSYYIPLSHFFVGVVNITRSGTFSPKGLTKRATSVTGLRNSIITIFVLYRLKRCLLARRVVQEYIGYSPLLLGCSLLDQKR
jgi:hypothetical protein